MTRTDEIIQIGQITIRFLLEGKDTNEQSAMFEFIVPSGAKVPLPHYHLHYDEIIYGVEGVITFEIEGKHHEVAPGQICFINRGAVHGFQNLSNLTAKALSIVTPAAIGPQFFKESAEIVNAGGPPDMEKMKIIFEKYGIVPSFPKKL